MDLNALAVETVTLVDRQFRSRDIGIELRLAESLPPVEGNPTQLQEILLNLLTNARDAMPDGGTVRIETWCSDKDEGLLYLRVSDTGKGIPADCLGKVFDPFFSTKLRGRGLGLAVVMGIMRSHDGIIRIDSEPEISTRKLLRWSV